MKRRGFAPFFPFADRADNAIELSPIKAVELQASRLSDVISLAQGIPSFDTPEPIKRYITEKIASGACAKYSLTPGLPQLRELISETLRTEGMHYDPDGEIIVTCGSIEAISASLLALVGPGDEVLVVSPTYASYIPAIRLTGATPRFVPLNEDANFDLDPDAIAAAITRRTRAILFSNPNNPTGTIYSVSEMRRLMHLAERHDLLVITDEVYKDFLYTDEPPGNPALFPECRNRVIRVCSFSKAYGMTGWRVGFLHTDRPLADSILRVHDALVTCAPVASQYGAIAALEFGAPFVEQFRDAFRIRRTRTIERLDALPDVFDYQKPNASYFAFPRIKDSVPLARDSRALASEILEQVRVALVPGIAFGPTGESHLRICYARELNDIDRAFDRLDDYFAGRRPRLYSTPAATNIGPSRHGVRRAAVATLQSLARLALARHHPKVIAIAGGHGKTVLKRSLSEALSQRYRVRANPLSYNTDIGLPLAILDTVVEDMRPATLLRRGARAVANALQPAHEDILILEFGARQPGDMQRLLRIVEPSLIVVMPLSPEYSEEVEGLAVQRAEIRVLVDHAAARNIPVVACSDDSSVAELAKGPQAHLFGRDNLKNADGRNFADLGGVLVPVEDELVGDSAVHAAIATAIVQRLLDT